MLRGSPLHWSLWQTVGNLFSVTSWCSICSHSNAHPKKQRHVFSLGRAWVTVLQKVPWDLSTPSRGMECLILLRHADLAVAMSAYCRIFIGIESSFFFFFCFYLFGCTRSLIVSRGVTWDLFPDQGSNLGSFHLGGGSLSHWTTREVPGIESFDFHFPLFFSAWKQMICKLLKSDLNLLMDNSFVGLAKMFEFICEVLQKYMTVVSFITRFSV